MQRNTGTREEKIYPSLDTNIKFLEANPESIYLKQTISLSHITAHVKNTLENVLIESTLKNHDGSIKSAALIKEYNKHVERSAFTTATIKPPFRDAWYLNPGQILLGHRNKVPEMMPFNKDKYILRDIGKLTDTTQIDYTAYMITDPFFGWNGSYVLNVPIGQYALAKSGNVPLLFSAGPHVIHDPNFAFNPKDGFKNQSSTYIKHQNIHIIRVPLGKLAKVWVNNIPYILPTQDEPYVFNDPLFKIEERDGDHFIDASENVIQHGTIHIIRVPVGKIAKVWVNNTPYLLAARDEPYVFNDPLFKFESNQDAKGKECFFEVDYNVIHHGSIHILRIPVGKVAKAWVNNIPILLEARDEPYIFNNPFFKIDKADNGYLFDATSAVISHGSKHIVRVPSGKIAKVWVNNEPLLLEARAEPYVYYGPLFRIDMNDKQPFFDATEKLIVHGSIKRVIPHTGEVAITYNGGKLEILEAKLDNTPILIQSPTHEVTGFLNVGVRNLVFPSDQTKEARSGETGHSKKDNDEVNLEIFTTSDSVLVGAKLFVSFEITDANKALLQLIDNKGILDHIENVARIDMGKAIKECTWREFLSFSQNKPEQARSSYMKDLEQLENKNEESSLKSFQDKVKNALSKDLAEFGIKLGRLNIETPRLVDKELAKKMSEQALNTAATAAKEALMEQNYRIAKREAEQKAETKRIEQDQLNAAKISQAQAELNAAKLSAEAQEIKAKADKASAILRVQGEAEGRLNAAKHDAEAKQLLAEAEKKAALARGQAFIDNPKLFELEKLQLESKVYAEAISKIPVFPQMPPGFFSSPFTYFNQSGTSPSLQNQPTHLHSLPSDNGRENTKKM